MNLTIKELLENCNATEYYTKHICSWRNEAASDLNEMIGRVQYQLETDGDECDIKWANAAFRTIDRVAEFEGIQKTKPRRKKK